MKKIVYRNIEFEEKTKKDLEISRAAMQTVLTEWLRLGLGPCMGLNDLVLRPRAVYDRAVNEAIKVPELSGPFKMNPTQYRDQLVLPDPSALYNACKQALTLPYCAMYGIFIVNDDTVELDQEAASDLINSQSIYATTPEMKKIAEDLQTFLNLFNSLNSRLNQELFSSGNPTCNAFFRGKFGFSDQDKENMNGKLVFLPEILKKWLGV